MLEQAMFADSMLETSWAHRSRRGWTTLTSFGVQAVLIALLMLIPILTTVGLPTARTVSTPISMGSRDPGPLQTTHRAHSAAVEIVPFTGRIVAPGRVPKWIAKGDDSPAPGPALFGNDIGSGLPIGSGPGLPLPFPGTRPLPPVPAAPPTVRPPFRTSSMLQGSLIRRVEPIYPSLARSARIQGTVVLAAVISKAGTIENLRLISGHPMLVPAAISAVSQWRYKPYILNDEVIEVETQITVNFVLGGGS